MELDDFEIHELTQDKLNDLPEGFFMCLSSPRRSGKTILLKHLMNMIRKIHKYDVVMLFSASSHLQKDDYNYIPENMRFQVEGFEEKLRDIIEKQTELIKEKGKEKTPNILLIFDDCQSANNDKGGSFKNSKVLEKMAIFSRHVKVSCILLIHSLTQGISSNNRKNLDLVFSFKSLNMYEKKFIAEHFLTYENNKDAKKKGYIAQDKVFNEPYKAIAIKLYNAQKSKSITDICFYIKAKLEEVEKFDFKIGHNIFWED